jgi:uncharacterized protein (TIGR02145 family)
MSNIKTTLDVVLSAQEQAAPIEDVSVPDTGLLNSTSAPIVFGVLAILIILTVVIATLIKRRVLRPHFQIAKKKSLVILLLTVFAVSGVASALIQFNIVNDNDASAVADGTITDDLLEVTGTSTGALTLNAGILGTEELAYIKDTITVSEEVSGPYTIYLTASDNKLVNAENPELSIPSITAAGTLTDKTFGYTIGNPEGQTDVTWNPVSATKTAIIKSNATVADKTFDVYYAVRAKDIEAGTYKIEMNYEISIDFDGTLQKMSSAICERMNDRTVYTFVDARDNKSYPVGKTDDLCIMITPLALELSTRMVLTNEDTDLNTVASYAPAENTRNSEPSDFTPMSSYKVKDGSTTFVVYGLYAAYPSPNVDIMKDFSMSDSLCPKGWHTYDSSFETSGDIAHRADKFDDGTLIKGPVAMLRGTMVNCVANTTALAKVAFEGATGAEPIAVVTTRGETEFILPEPTEEREGYEFIGWSVKDDGTVDYLPNVTYTLGSISNKLYAVWAKKITGVAYMQDFTDSACSTLNVGKQYALRDKRDEKLYSITKMKDGGCWMTRDLDFDVVAGETLTSDTTALVDVTSWTFSKADERKTLKDDSGAHYYHPDVAMIGDGGLKAKPDQVISYEDHLMGITDSSICPAGWHLPGIGVTSALWESYSKTARDYVRAYNQLYGSSDNPAAEDYNEDDTIVHIEDYFQASDAGLLYDMEKHYGAPLAEYETAAVYLSTDGAMRISRVKDDNVISPIIKLTVPSEYIDEQIEIMEGIVNIEKEYGPNFRDDSLKSFAKGKTPWVPVRCMYTPRGYEPIDPR